MVSKLKQRRMRRYKSDIAWWMAEAQDWKDIALEHATEIDRLKKLIIRVPMPVVVPESVAVSKPSVLTGAEGAGINCRFRTAA